MTWYAQARPRHRDSGKFHSRHPFGTEKTPGGTHLGWSYSFVAHETSGTVPRKRYSVSISNSSGRQVAYLRDFCDLQQAAKSAREWIEVTQQFETGRSPSHSLGSIPIVPTSYTAQLK